MSDLISREAAIDAILAEVEDEDRPIVETRWWNIGMTRASVIVHDMPSAQSEIIRCKDCKHRHDDGYCEAWGESFHYWEDFNIVPEDMFCGYGERREDETD